MTDSAPPPAPQGRRGVSFRLSDALPSGWYVSLCGGGFLTLTSSPRANSHALDEDGKKGCVGLSRGLALPSQCLQGGSQLSLNSSSTAVFWLLWVLHAQSTRRHMQAKHPCAAAAAAAMKQQD